MATGNDLPTLDERAGEGESLPVMDTHFPTRADFLKKINKTERNFTVKYSIITFLYIFIVSNLKRSLKIKQGKKWWLFMRGILLRTTFLKMQFRSELGFLRHRCVSIH